MPLISFEGSEGCGKSTQIGILSERLEQTGVRPIVLREPGGTPIGEVIRDLLQHAEVNRGMAPEAELLLFAASRAQLVRERIAPALEQGAFVLCDRFFDSTTVYQGAGRKLNPSFVENLNAFAVGDFCPAITFLLEVDPKISEARLAQRSHSRRDRMEEQPADFYRQVCEGYRELARRETERIVVLDGNGAPETIAAEVWARMIARFPQLQRAEANS